MINICYIIGVGRSGSTILEAVMGSLDQGTAIGESITGLRNFKTKCSCRLPIKKCKFWSKIIYKIFENNYEEFMDQVNRAIRFYNFYPMILLYKFRLKFEFLKNTYSRFYLEVAKAKTVNFIFDSSKSPSLVSLFLYSNKKNQKAIHLVRNLRGVMSSHEKDYNKGHRFRFLNGKIYIKNKYLRLIIVALEWNIYNLNCLLMKFIFKKQIKTIRYENFSKFPEETFNNEILPFLGLNYQIKFEELQLNIDHQMAGNPTRFKTEKFKIYFNESYKESQNYRHKIIYLCFGFPSNLIFKEI